MPCTEPGGGSVGDTTEDRQVRAFEAGWGAALAEVLAVLDDLRATNPALPLQMRLDWDGALDAVRHRLSVLQTTQDADGGASALQAAHDAEGEGETRAPRA